MAQGLGRTTSAPQGQVLAAPVAMPELPGIVIESLLGRGGMGTVYLGRQVSLDRPVAVKVLAAEVADDPLFLERLEREARIMARLRHPNIVTVYDFQPLPEGGAAIVMEYVEGGSLRDLLRKQPNGLPLREARRLAGEVAAGLTAAHKAGVIHRDMKPENVLIGHDGMARVTDFGVAVPLQEGRVQLTLTGTAVGTVDYMAPEQLKGGTQDVRVDIYALGVLTYELLTGQTPRGSFAPPQLARRGTPPMLSAAVMRALRPEPARRFASMESFAQTLLSRAQPLLSGVAIACVILGLLTALAAVMLNQPTENPAAEDVAAVSNSAPAPAAPPSPAPAAAIPQSFGPWVDAVAGVRIHNDNYGGDWTNEDGILTSNNAICVMALEREMPPSYDARMRFTRLGGKHSVTLFFRATNGTIGSAELDAWDQGLAGVQLIQNETLQEGYGFRFPIENGRSYELLVEVRPNHIRMSVDGVFLKEFEITNKVLHPPTPWNWDPFTRPAALAVGSYESPTRFEKVEWREVGKGK